MYTLVRHSMWSSEAYPLFRNGLEVLAVGPTTARVIRELGGLVYHNIDSAWDGAEGYMYPEGDTRVPANPRGEFHRIFFLRQPLFVPAMTEDLIAA